MLLKIASQKHLLKCTNSDFGNHFLLKITSRFSEKIPDNFYYPPKSAKACNILVFFQTFSRIMSPYMGPNPCPKVIILHLNLFPFGVALKSAYFPVNLILRQTGKGEGNLMFLNQTFLARICYQNHFYCLSVYFSEREK